MKIFPNGYFCDPWGMPNQKIWVPNLGIFFCILMLLGVPWNQKQRVANLPAEHVMCNYVITAGQRKNWP